MKKNNQALKIPRWTGRPELWMDNKSRIVVRTSEFHAELLDYEKSAYWKFIAFKEAFTFEFFNGSKHLLENGFELIERI